MSLSLSHRGSACANDEDALNACANRAEAPKKTYRYALLACALSGLCGGIVFSHWIAGIDWHSPLSALDASGPYIPMFTFGSWLLGWFCLVPFLSVLFTAPRRTWLQGTLLFAFLWHLTSLVWLATLVPFNPFIPLGVVLLPLALSLFTLLFSALFRWVAARIPTGAWPILAPTLWVGVDYFRSLGPFAFPWNFLGHSQALGNTWGCQIVDHVGTYGLTWIMVFVNATLGLAVTSTNNCVFGKARLSLPKRQWRVLGGVLILLLGWQFVAYPLWFTKSFQSLLPIDIASHRVLSAIILQPNIAQTEKMRFYTAADFETARQLDAFMTNKVLNLLERATSAPTSHPPTLAVLPESAFNSSYFVYDTALHKKLEDKARAAGIDILFGADRREPYDEYRQRLLHAFSGFSQRKLPSLDVCVGEDGTTWPCERSPMASTVAAFFVQADSGLTTTVYDKIRLVPFGETAPIFDKIPGFQELVLMVGSYARGTEYTIFRTQQLSFGVMICFESVFSDLAGEYARRQADSLCVITNDGWYDIRHLRTPIDFWGANPGAESEGFALGRFWSRATRWLSLTLVPDSWLKHGPIQHFAHSVLRAIEIRRPLIRSANTGISAFISEDGRIRAWKPWGHEGYLKVSWPLLSRQPTLLTRWGEWVGLLCAVVLVAAALLALADGLKHPPRRSVSACP